MLRGRHGVAACASAMLHPQSTARTRQSTYLDRTAAALDGWEMGARTWECGHAVKHHVWPASGWHEVLDDQSGSGGSSFARNEFSNDLFPLPVCVPCRAPALALTLMDNAQKRGLISTTILTILKMPHGSGVKHARPHFFDRAVRDQPGWSISELGTLVSSLRLMSSLTLQDRNGIP